MPITVQRIAIIGAGLVLAGSLTGCGGVFEAPSGYPLPTPTAAPGPMPQPVATAESTQPAPPVEPAQSGTQSCQAIARVPSGLPERYVLQITGGFHKTVAATIAVP